MNNILDEQNEERIRRRRRRRREKKLHGRDIVCIENSTNQKETKLMGQFRTR